MTRELPRRGDRTPLWASLAAAAALSLLVAPARLSAGTPPEVDLVDTIDDCAGAEIGVAIGQFGAPPTDRAVGYRFTVDAEGSWLPVELTACVSTESAPHSHAFTLRVDDGGLPGEEIYFFTLLVPASPALVTAPANKRPALLSFGDAYWIVAEEGFASDAWWLPTAPSLAAPMAESLDGAPFVVTAPDATVPQLRLHAVPEPSGAAGGAAAALAAAVLLPWQRRRRLASLGAVVALGLAVHPAQAEQQGIDFTDFGTYATDSFALCGTNVLTDEAAVLSLSASGLGVDGPLGSNASQIDGSETLSFVFAPPGATQVSYHVVAAGNQNGSGAVGEAFVEAFEYVEGGSPASLGVQPVSGTGTKDVSALFGGVPILYVRITASGDGHRIGSLSFRPAPEGGLFVVFGTLGTFLGSSYERCGLSITGSANVFLSPGGLGVDDAVFPHALQGSEWLEFAFDLPRERVSYFSSAVAELNGNAIAAQAFVQAFDANGASLGAVAVSGEEGVLVWDLFGDVPISKFRVTANGDAQAIEGLLFSPEPGATAATLGVAIALGIVGSRRSRR